VADERGAIFCVGVAPETLRDVDELLDRLCGRQCLGVAVCNLGLGVLHQADTYSWGLAYMFLFCSHCEVFRRAELMPDITFIRAQIERMRVQVSRQRREILTLQKAGINSLPAEALLARMLANIDNMCAERDRLKREQPVKENMQGSRNR
jgi:hypothetical protein